MTFLSGWPVHFTGPTIDRQSVAMIALGSGLFERLSTSIALDRHLEPACWPAGVQARCGPAQSRAGLVSGTSGRSLGNQNDA